MKGVSYLEGANPYPPEVISEYIANGWWQNLTYGDILDQSTERYLSKIAVIDETTQLTYSQLREKVDRFAIALLELGVKKYDRLLLQLPNRHEFVIVYYAMQRIGAVPMLAIPRHGYREMSHFFMLTEPVGWIVPLRDRAYEFSPLIDQVRPEAKSLKHLIMIEDGEKLPVGALSLEKLIADVRLSDYPIDYLKQFQPDPNDVALILPTGGTTGLPKGVPRTHNSYLAWSRYTMMGLSDMSPEHIIGLATPIGHAMAQGSVTRSILMGAALAVIAVPQAREIMESIQKNKITFLALVPTQLEDILNHPDLEKYDFSSLRILVTAGAALRPETAQKAQEFFNQFGTDFRGSGFGSTEGPTAVHSVGESVPPEIFRTSVGKPICGGDHWKVIDEQERELPTDSEGELVAKGPSVFSGYYKSEAENKEIFSSDGYYKMGDLGKIDEEGHIFITGRKKDIIQRGGEGMVPSEIESLLYMHPDIEAASVVAMPDARLGEKACAYVVLRPGKTLDLHTMVDFLKGLGAGKLLLPERLETVGELPKTPFNKVDKKALRQDIEERLKKEGVV
jgi:2,3-dihydroxybenzoate-AMP ligase/mycobactin salicyl-AMP ligase